MRRPHPAGLPATVAPGRPAVASPGAVPAVIAGASAAGVSAIELAGMLHELTVRLLSSDDLAQAVERLAAFVVRALPDVLRCSVLLITEGDPVTRAAAGPGAEAVDDLQFTQGQGPGLEAARTRALVTSQDLAADDRWPDLAPCAAATGVRSVAAVPLDVQRSSVGSLTLFLPGSHEVTPDLLLTTMAVAGQAEVLLGELRRRDALGEGAIVDRAVGVIIAQRGCGVQEAYEVLRETAQRLGLDREAVAGRLIAAAARHAAP